MWQIDLNLLLKNDMNRKFRIYDEFHNYFDHNKSPKILELLSYS